MQRDTKVALSPICTSLDDMCVTSGCQTGIYNSAKKKKPTNLQILIMMKYYLEMSTLRLVTDHQASLVAQLVKTLPASAGDPGSISGSGRSPGEGHGNRLQYSCLENSMDRGA